MGIISLRKKLSRRTLARVAVKFNSLKLSFLPTRFFARTIYQSINMEKKMHYPNWCWNHCFSWDFVFIHLFLNLKSFFKRKNWMFWNQNWCFFYKKKFLKIQFSKKKKKKKKILLFLFLFFADFPSVISVDENGIQHLMDVSPEWWGDVRNVFSNTNRLAILTSSKSTSCIFLILLFVFSVLFLTGIKGIAFICFWI